MSVKDNGKVVCVSGGFDPVHIGHLRMINEATSLGRVVVIVNSDDSVCEALVRLKPDCFANGGTVTMTTHPRLSCAGNWASSCCGIWAERKCRVHRNW
ncbi:adenylyltransferase/cytidyltransferase family protein [Endozoicomonas gorgoniicola]|uniref:Adenylyltransferase/cytidyltransferase family protein n=1 Tax=Endozoicomonas gorgoniicola TaxID=1234144 RepID=A0ABT3MPR9_9GAMM|nr:adenylyltransferase/cytidyltransferase family protein [Endozoicomonas gorgoniicola]MCW7551356.1 adenylyltransferase/cytidyltransferase family protein [Endozoicomonas gorgoniicola]